MATALLILALTQGVIPWGQVPLREVRVAAPTEVSGRARELLALASGQVVTRSDVRAGVQALLLSGEFVDATVRAEMTPDGLLLEVATTPAQRLGEVRFEGLSGGLKRQVEGVLDLVPGAVFDSHALEAGLEEARRVLRGAGYPEARLEARLEPVEGRLGMGVRVVAHLGPPLLLTRLVAPGSELSSHRVQEITRLRPGVLLSQDRLERARRRLATHLRREGWWAAEVRPARIATDDRGTAVILEVERGPRYQLKLTGLTPSKALLTAALPFVLGEEPFEESELETVFDRLSRYCQEEGRLLVEVSGEVLGAGEERTLRIAVRRVDKQPIREVRFAGLDGFPERILRDKIGARRGRPWVWGREGVTAETLEWDRVSLRTVLQREGWADAEVQAARLEQGKGGVTIEFPITMGARRSVSDVVIEGMVEGVAAPPLPLSVGGPWSRSAEEEARVLLEGALRNAGYLDARVAVSSRCEAGACAVRLAATPGLMVVLDRVVVAGLVRTSERVVRRLSTLKPGEPLGAAQQLETQRRLLSPGIFQSATVRPMPGQEHQPRRGVVIDLKEAPLRAYGFGLGWDTEAGVRASASWSHLNPLGTGGALFTEASYSERRTRLQLTYREPSPLGLFGIPLWLSIYRYNADFGTFSLLERGMWLELGDRERQPGRLVVRYEYQIVAPQAPPEILSGLEREKQNLKIASVVPYAVWDSRDDLFSPRKGVLARAELQSAFKMFLADAAFDKVSLSLAGYRPASHGTLAGAVRAGVAVPRYRTGAVADNLLLPINVRFFAGGQVSHRAFALDRLGVPGQTLDGRGQPLGGAALLLANLEWRRPLVGAVGLNLFLDGGNVWASLGQVKLDQARWGAGVGLRFETPVGPLRLEYGWKLDRQQRESAGELFFSLGNPF